MFRNTVVHVPYMTATLRVIEHLLSMIPVAWWVKGDDSASHFNEALAAQIKLQTDTYIGHHMSIGKCL